mmetsp:Transcript_56191/g.100096  ORF Transcript_56191/g.100096 Transcript_56191/m.100096 type:complete len:970 (-) Transcript_56191:54-2963(-)
MAAGTPEVADEQECAPKTVLLELSPSAQLANAEAATPEPAQSELPLAEEPQRPNVLADTPETPAGKGPLYKCAICGEFVYESQLEHHVTVCPDPKESSPPASPEQEVGVLQSPIDEEIEDRNLDEAFAELHMASEATQKMWKQWKDSELAAHHDKMIQQTYIKRQKHLNERRKKEEEECTFKPQTLPRGSPRTYSRPDDTGEGKWIQRWDQRMRSQKLKQVEAQHYAELTLKPKISPFAQAWSTQKDTEVMNEGQELSSVFERLYQAALAKEERQITALRERDALEQADVVGHVNGSLFRTPQSRRVPTSELLYSDAIDRRERLRIMAEQLELRREEESKEKRAVLNRSRRYYWQMLERQIKASFEATTGGHPLLSMDLLEVFLVDFKCMRTRKGDPDAPTPEDIESQRLQAALWRHLDPNKTGHTDLLTMTVFFHVLMGAVDEAAHGASRSLVGATEDSSPAHSPSRMIGSPRSGGGAASLHSINEEAEANGLHDGGLDLGAAMESATQDDEGRRIVELLLRFDPCRLRVEFQPLYSHRMHYVSQQEKHPQPKEETPAVKPPKIDSQSKVMANRLMRREQGESGKATHADILLWRHSKVQAKQEQRRVQAKHEEVSSCTFRPRCTRPKPHEGQVEVMTPAGTTRAEVLYARGLAERERKEQKVAEAERARSGAEVRNCTFRPNTEKSVRSYTRSSEQPNVVPRGFYESRQRLRAAHEARKEQLYQREERMAKLAPQQPQSQMLGPAGGMSTSSVPGSPGMQLGLSELSHGSVSSVLPTVAEEGRRRSVSPRINTGKVTRQRSAGATRSPRPGIGRLQPPPRSSSQPPAAKPAPVAPAQPQSQDDIPASNDSLRSGGGSEGTLVAPALDGAGSPPPVLVPAPNAEVAQEAAEVTPPAAQEEEDPPPVLYVDVNIAPGQPPERIILREGQSISEVAADFAAKHVLTPVLAQRLHSLLREVVQRQEEQAKQ